jgi:hypothetical protein
MKRVGLAMVCSLCLFASTAFAQQDAHHAAGGVGFHDISAPVGIRWWMSGQKLAIDLGVGFGDDPSFVDPSEKVSHWAIDAGVPIVMHSWEGVHILFRPGLLYTSQEVGFIGPGAVFDTDNETTLSVRAELEGEIFLRDNFSVSASTGIEYVDFQPADDPFTPGSPDSQSSFGTIGRQFTDIGFHMYFLGAHQ